jgi:hypothetical protein
MEWARQHKVSMPIEGLMRRGSAAALAAIRIQPAGPERDRLLLLAIARQDLSQASKPEVFADISAEAQPFAAARIAAKFGKTLDRGIAWARALPPGPARLAAWEELGFYAETPVDLPPGPDRDAMLLGRFSHGGRIQSQDPKLDLVLQIGDSATRREAFDAIMRFSDRKPGLKEWMKTAAVPEEWKERWNQSNHGQP